MKFFLTSKFIRPAGFGVLLAAAVGCSVGEQNQEGGKFPATDAGRAAAPAPTPRQQLKAVRTYAKTTFRLAGIEEAQLAGLDVQPRGTEVTLPPQQVSQLAAAARGADNVPLRLRLRLEARNPNRDKVMLHQLDYLVLVDNREIASGTTDDMMEIAARSTLSIPLTLTANVRESLTAGLAPEALATAISSWNRQPARLQVKVRPTFQNATGRAFRTTDFEPIQASAAK